MIYKFEVFHLLSYIRTVVYPENYYNNGWKGHDEIGLQNICIFYVHSVVLEPTCSYLWE